VKKILRALCDSEYKIIPAEQQGEIEKDIFDTYMGNLLPTKASDPLRNTWKDRGFCGSLTTFK